MKSWLLSSNYLSYVRLINLTGTNFSIILLQFYYMTTYKYWNYGSHEPIILFVLLTNHHTTYSKYKLFFSSFIQSMVMVMTDWQWPSWTYFHVRCYCTLRYVLSVYYTNKQRYSSRKWINYYNIILIFKFY